MAYEDQNVDAMLSTVKAAASEVGSHIVEAVLSLDGAKVPVAGIGANDLAALIRAVRPRVIYCMSVPFDAGVQIGEDLFGDDANEALLERPRIKKLVSKWRSRDGQTAQISAVAVVDGVMHGLLVEASWYVDYEADVEAHAEETDRIRDERERRVEVEAKKRLAPYVTQLMADPRFSGPKVGRAKRLALAGEMFPDEDRKVLGEVVEIAESRHWLAAGR